MGGKQSKPLAESARTVLARRKAPLPSESPGVNPTINPNVAPKISPVQPSTATQNPKQYDGFRPEEAILKEMSKWDFVKATKIESSKVRSGLPSNDKLPLSAQQMASVVRHEEEKKVKEMGPAGLLDGRLSENQLLELYRLLRDTNKTVEEVGAEFKISGKSVATLAKIARMPTVVDDPRNEDTLIAK